MFNRPMFNKFMNKLLFQYHSFHYSIRETLDIIDCWVWHLQREIKDNNQSFWELMQPSHQAGYVPVWEATKDYIEYSNSYVSTSEDKVLVQSLESEVRSIYYYKEIYAYIN